MGTRKNRLDEAVLPTTYVMEQKKKQTPISLYKSGVQGGLLSRTCFLDDQALLATKYCTILLKVDKNHLRL